MPTSKKPKVANLINNYHLLSFDELDSTNEEAKRLAHGGGHHGAVIWAKKQTGGTGRLGREWVSREGNLFVSILLQPGKPLAELPQLSFVAAVAAIETLQPILGREHPLHCKWPNDILLDGKKLGGILLESFRTEGSRKPWVIVGIGINVEHFPSDVQFPATCMRDAGMELISAKIILSRFIHHFIECYDTWDIKGFGLIRRKWLNAAWKVGKRMEARLPEETIKGIFRGIDTTGRLAIELSDGSKRMIDAGEVYAPVGETA